jgi:hypothetical protein
MYLTVRPRSLLLLKAPLAHSSPARTQGRGQSKHSFPCPPCQSTVEQTVGTGQRPIIERFLQHINTRTSKTEKVNLICHILRPSGLSFGDLIRAWIESAPGKATGKARQAKAKQVIDVIWNDDMLPLFEEMETFNELVTDSTIKVISSELEELHRSPLFFKQYDPSVNIEDVNFENAYREIKEHSPNLSRLVEGSSLCKRPDQHIRQDQPGRVVAIVAMLSLARARQSADFLTRILGIYLHSSGVKRRVISTLHGLGLVDSYRTIHRTIKEIAECSQGSIFV